MYKIRIISLDDELGVQSWVKYKDYKIGDIVEISDESYRLNHRQKWFEVVEHFEMEKETIICDKCGKKTVNWTKKTLEK